MIFLSVAGFVPALGAQTRYIPPSCLAISNSGSCTDNREYPYLYHQWINYGRFLNCTGYKSSNDNKYKRGYDYVMLRYVALRCATLRYVALRYATLSYVMLCYAMLCYAMLCYVMLCYVMLCYVVMLCYAMLCYVMLCYVVFCYAMLCYAMLCYVMLRYWRKSPTLGQVLLIHKVSRSHTTTQHCRWDSSGRVISSSQRPLPDNTQHSQQTSMPPLGFEHTASESERPQTYALDRAVAGTGEGYDYCLF